jgi:DNA-binding NarL/FixJ family response regulator
MSQDTTAAPATPATVLLIDDHPLVRKGMVDLINGESDLKVVADVGTVAEAVDAVGKHQPQIVVCDLSLRDGSGLDLIRQLHQTYPSIPILVLSMHDESLYAERVLRHGASGYIMKHEATDQVLAAIRQVLKGEMYLSPALAGQLLQRLVVTKTAPGQSPLTKLSDRELEIFQLIGRGLPSRQIAEMLFLSVKTVETHRENIKRKLGINSAGELLRFAIEQSLAGKD